jgi:hypothetical protein
MATTEEIKAEKDMLEEENKVLKEAFQRELDIELSDLPVHYRGLVSALPIAKQVAWIEEYKKEHPSKKSTGTKQKTWEDISGIPPKPETPRDRLNKMLDQMRKNHDKEKEHGEKIDQIV